MAFSAARANAVAMAGSSSVSWATWTSPVRQARTSYAYPNRKSNRRIGSLGAIHNSTSQTWATPTYCRGLSSQLPAV